MPMYQTKTLAGILEPVAQQVSKLIILHEEGEGGNAMPDLERPVLAVGKAVQNLIRVGKDTINSSQDSRLKSEMPKSLSMIEKAAELLEKACAEMKHDPFSQSGRDQLISGSRGILQGTTSMLVVFDESQVRKICRDCKKVLDYLAVSEVIETMEDLVQFVKDLSPCLSKMCQDVDARRRDLLNPYQRENLGQHLEQVKTLAPILICSMKIFIQILSQEGKGTDEAIENRNYLAKRMTEEIGQITQILEDVTKADGRVGVVDGGGSLFIKSQSSSEQTFHKILSSVTKVTLSHHQLDQRTLRQIAEMGYQVADSFEGTTKSDLQEVCSELERTSRSQAHSLNDVQTKQRVQELASKLESRVSVAVIGRIIHDLADITTPLKQFREAVQSGDRAAVDRRSHALKAFAASLSKTANVVAFARARDGHRSRALRHLSSQVQTLTPQLINAGTIRMNYPENRAAEENFENLCRQFAEDVQSIRDLCDECVDTRIFLQQTEAELKRALQQCEYAISTGAPHVESSALAARLANRLLMALQRESDNSDDANLRRQVESVCERLKAAIASFVECSKSAPTAPAAWKTASARLLDVVADVEKLFSDLNMYGPEQPTLGPPPPPVAQIAPPPRPPLPQEARVPGRPPVPADTDDEEGLFTAEPSKHKPIHAAAHGLYQEVRQWDHTDNEIIAAAKKIAYLMAHLSDLVGRGTKKELLACARGLAEVSERITELAKELARHCTDKKIRTNLLQVCEKIPTLGTQLRVLSTVKATMMGNNMDTEEDQEAMDMLVFNAQKLNEAVKETVRAAESASIRVRSDAGFRLKWIRKPPVWYQ